MGHVLCQHCIERWFKAKNQLRDAEGLAVRSRRECPVCKTELRLTGEMRQDAANYHLGLQKVPGTWPED